MTQQYTAGMFTIDCMTKSYAGVTTGATWNGWECPLFEYPEAKQVLEDLQSKGELTFRIGNETSSYPCLAYRGLRPPAYFIVDDPEFPDFYEFRPNSDGLYAIGAWGWCWEKA